MPIHPLGHYELFILLLQVATLLAVARFLGELCRRIKIPSVIGELGAGVLLGPAVFGVFLPRLQQTLFPPVQLQSDLLSVITWLGVIFLLLCTGLETDLALIRRQGRKALLISGAGIVIPFLSGFLLGYLLPEVLLNFPINRLLFALFLATAMSISAIPVIARILMELNVMRRNIGQLILACGMVDDTIGWILLSLVAGLASGGALDVWIPVRSVIAVAAVLLFSFTIGKSILAIAYRWVDDHAKDVSGLVSLTVVFVVLASAITLKLGLEAVLGAFIFGILLRNVPRYRPSVTQGLEEITRLVLSPIFFAAAGLKVTLTVFADYRLLSWALIVLLVACLGKFIGAYIGATRAKLGKWEALAIGSGMNARGAMEIIVATIGLSLGVLSTDMYSIIVFVAIATSMMAPPLLRLALRHVVISPEEARRLEREALERKSFWAGVRHILLPTRGGGNIRFAASLVGRALNGRNIDVTVLTLDDSRHFPFSLRKQSKISESALHAAAQALYPLTTRLKTIPTKGHNIARIITKLGEEHDLIILGAYEGRNRWADHFTFSPIIDDVLQTVPCPVLVVRSPGSERVSISKLHTLRPIRSILVPTTGTSIGRAATEFGLALAKASRARCTLLFVKESSLIDEATVMNVPLEENTHPMGELGEQAFSREAASEIIVERRIVHASKAGHAIVQVALKDHFDLIVLGAQLRPGAQGAYLGPQVDFILRSAPCPVAVLVTQ